MKATKPGTPVSIGLIVSGLLLILAANCSPEKKTTATHIHEQVQPVAIVEQAESAEADEQIAQEAPRTQPQADPVAESDSRETKVENSFCAVCHYGFDEEELALNHRAANIGCQRCHGESLAHRSDENNITPPEIMYAKEKINPFCMTCHPGNKIVQKSVHEAVLSAEASPQKHCTDCHGKEHRINVRTTRWNKITGELLKK